MTVWDWDVWDRDAAKLLHRIPASSGQEQQSCLTCAVGIQLWDREKSSGAAVLVTEVPASLARITGRVVGASDRARAMRERSTRGWGEAS